MNPVRTSSTRRLAARMKWWSLTMLVALMVTHLSVAAAQTAPVGNGFTVTSGDVQATGSDVVITVTTGPVTFQELRR